MRKQYYFRPSPRGLLAWDVDRLIEQSTHLPRRLVPLRHIRELDQEWFRNTYPIILSADGAVMDGMHRVAKARDEGREHIEAVQFERDPDADHVGKGPADLPYDDEQTG
jgi:hypothetical protein